MSDGTKPEVTETGARDRRRAQLGAVGEQLAAEHLLRRGFKIVERNYRTRWGELDIIAVKDRTIVFCEVKTRVLRRGPNGIDPEARDPLESVHARKRSKIRRLAARWLVERQERPRADELRFDAIGIAVDATGSLLRLDHLEGAF
jgi:putative endonuclease